MLDDGASIVDLVAVVVRATEHDEAPEAAAVAGAFVAAGRSVSSLLGVADQDDEGDGISVSGVGAVNVSSADRPC